MPFLASVGGRSGRFGRPRRRTVPYTWSAKSVAVLLLVEGVGILVYWAKFYLDGNLPDGLYTLSGGSYIAFHIAAEVVVALAAIAGGLGILRGREWGMAASLVAVGGLLYTGINSLSWSLPAGDSLTRVFGAVAGLALLSLIGLHFGRRR
ncbi:MAG: hypothetical protein K6U08_00495 [Firmicutes bacterium]|nr:hypothetical protein [Bacillota bacterium]